MLTAANLKDKHYRRYALGVERALSTFDTAQQEWADYISFLSRLLKALQAHPPELHVIPDRQIFGQIFRLQIMSVLTYFVHCV